MKIRLTPYNQQWPKMFEEEANFLKSIFNEEIIQLEHFGSTSIVGMKAKPVIDIICIVKNIEVIDAFNETMRELGYDVAGEWGIAGRRLFRKGGDNRSHHLHFYEEGHHEIARHLIFRDYLTVHEKEAEAYCRLKEELAQRYEQSSDYSHAKKQFVSEMEKRALNWHEQIKKKAVTNKL